MRLYSKVAQTKVQVPRYAIGDLVRISNKKLVFRKKYEQTFSKEIFKINKIHTVFPVVSYTLEDLKGAILDGSFIEGDLSKINNENGA